MSVPNPATTDWVPMWSMGAGIGLSYKGAWVAGNYNEGDVVINNGVLYMAANATSTTPTGWSMGRAATPLVTSAQMTALVPFDGQEILLIVDATNGINWRFRYNSASASAYKWEFIGGPFWWTLVDTSEAPGSLSAWVELATVQRFQALRAGVYYVAYGCHVSRPATANAEHQIGVAVAAPTVARADYFSPDAVQRFVNIMAEETVTVATALDILKLQFRSFSAAGTYENRWMRVIPVRVS